ncbi:MAG: DUF4292 domain-containing protein, partial [Flavobacteriaceae bacterium]|nr:DUF4292 domain-containing protein [Flavobacteriaceae bacterium]
MKFFRLILIVMLVFTSCKTKKGIVGSTAMEIKKLSARKVSKKHIATSFDKKTIDARLKVAYKSDKDRYNLNVKLRIDKDKVIWINVVYKSVILVARAKITPSSVSYYEKINKTYFKGGFDVLEEMLGAEVNFKQLQNMLLGQAIFDLKEQKYTSVVHNEAHLLVPAQQKALFDILFWINPVHFKLDMQTLKNNQKNQELKVAYKSYSNINGVIFPKRIEIRAIEKGKFTNID